MSGAFFRANAGACVLNGENHVLALKRKGVAGNAWQMPQGGIDEGEEPRAAVLRELEEETGLQPHDVDIVADYPGWLIYELPLEYRNPKIGLGQAQRWFLLRAHPGAKPQPDGIEFEDYAWMPPAALMPLVVEFRRPIYEAVFNRFLTR